MKLAAFLKDERGAVSVDWIVLSGACTILGVLVTQTTSAAIEDLAQDIGHELGSDDPYRNYFDELTVMVSVLTYEPLSQAHQSGSDADSWASNAFDVYSSFDTSTLSDYYDTYYERATDGSTNGDSYLQAVDHIAVIENVFEVRGVDIPEGNMTAEELASAAT